MAEWVMPAAKAVEALSTSPERALVSECQQGNPHAFARLVALHEAMVFSLAFRLLGDAEEARDLAQDVFLLIYRTVGRFQGRSSLKTWIYRIVVNQCANRRRTWMRRKRSRSVPIDDLSVRDEAVLVADTSPERDVGRREEAALMQRALARISFDHRAILLLRETEDLSCEEISIALGVPLGTVKSRLARAREALREAFVAVDGRAKR